MTCISRKQADSDAVFALKTNLAQCTSDLEKAEDKAEHGETKIVVLKEVVANILKSREVSEEQASEYEKSYKENIKTLTSNLKKAEARAESAEKSLDVSEE